MKRWTLTTDNDNWQTDTCAQDVCAALIAGELVGVPTETVYGLAADATNPDACARIYAAKGRPQFNPLISHVSSLRAALEHGVFNEQALKLATQFWPGPLTLVVPKRVESSICDLATAGLDTVALRVPAGPVMRFLSEKSGRPLAAPSANISGRISTTTAEAVAADLSEEIAFLVDAGPCDVGIESTIIALTNDTPRLLRPGGISRQQLEETLGTSLHAADNTAEQPQAPGMLSSHYAPHAQVRLNAVEVHAGEALLSFGPCSLATASNASRTINLSETGDLTEAAARLFGALRDLDASGAKTICVQAIPETGLGEAINDRLRRAAAPRS